MAIFNNILAGAAGQTGGAAAGYEIERSLRFNTDDGAYLDRTPLIEGNRKTYTFSCWLKRSSLGQDWIFNTRKSANNNSNTVASIRFTNNDEFEIAGRSLGWYLLSDATFRDFSAWYHIVVSVDTTNSTGDDRVKAWINGKEMAGTRLNPSLDFETGFNQTQEHRISGQAHSNSYKLHGYLADIYFIDGQALAATDFGEYDSNNVWQPKAYSGTYGTNGFYLDFSDNTNTTTIAEDSSGNNNDWTANNISVASGPDNDSLIDTPTNYEASSGNNGGNYATFNPIGSEQDSNAPLVDGNLAFSTSGYTNTCTTFVSTIAVSSGKWYFEGESTNNVGQCGIGIIGARYIEKTSNTNRLFGQFSDGYVYEADGGDKSNDNTNSSYGSSWRSPGNIAGCAFDADNGTLEFFLNGVSQGVAYSNIPQGKYYLAIGVNKGSSASSQGMICTFGQRPFAQTPPTGYKALCTTNLPDPTIADGSTAMDATLYTGNGSTQSITGLGFQPDLVWIKNRATTDEHKLTDSVRGVTKEIASNSNDPQVTNLDGLTAFNSDGFTLGDDLEYNTNSEAYVAWSWDASTTTGFSIVTYTGTGSVRTVNHNLNTKPYLIIIKQTSGSTRNWSVYTEPTGATKYLRFNTDIIATTSAAHWNDTEPTNTVFTVNTNATVNANNESYVAYCWAPVEGYSAFGSYTGNGSTDGPFVYTGFRPRWILIKPSSTTGNWLLHDTERDAYNASDSRLFPNLSNAEQSDANGYIDVLSNGFKLRNATTGYNQNGATHVFACFASHPFQTARAR